MNIEQLKENLAAINKCLSLSISDPTNGNELVHLLNEAMAMEALSADCVARAESYLTNEIAKVVESGKYDKIGANDRKHLIHRDCGVYVELYNKAEKYNKGLHYRVESLRTLISNAKELLRQQL